MADKYAGLRPKRSRSCHRGDRVPKKGYTRKQAVAAAERWAGYHAYRCPECGRWHVGRIPKNEETKP